MKDSYLTLREFGSNEFIINKSRFIGYGSPAETEQDALNFLQQIRTKHKDASHNCYAYIIGENGGIMRYSDDGEPGGTAGMPILQVMKSKNLVNCCVVVTRYFGGILLGAGGLTRAYTQGAAVACSSAGIVKMEMTCQYLCEVSYSLWNKVDYIIPSMPVEITDQQFTTAVTFTLLIRSCDEARVMEKLTALCEGRIEYLLEDKFFHPWKA